jgi:hypothetical protein
MSLIPRVLVDLLVGLHDFEYFENPVLSVNETNSTQHSLSTPAHNSFSNTYPPNSSSQSQHYRRRDPGHEATRRPQSRSGSSLCSVNSSQSTRGHRISKSFSRKSSASGRANSMGSAASSAGLSSSSGRQGPLDSLARAGMRALKAIGGACWRCKILRKVVSAVVRVIAHADSA